MEFKEQLEIAEDAIRKALIIALEEKKDFKANKLFKVLADIRDIVPIRYEPGAFSISNSPNSPDVIFCNGDDSGGCLG